MKTIGPLLRQYAVVVTVNLCSLSIGMSIGWSSPGLVKLRDARQTTLARPITEEEGSWIVSFSFLAAVVAVFAAAFLMDHIGRKLSVILAAVLKIVVGVVQTLATEVWVVMLTRALVGGLDAIDTCVIPAYASEVASKEIRGALGTIFNIFIALGVVVMLAIGPFCSYVTLNILYSSVTLAATLPLVFVPESPYFLYAKGRKDQTHNVLTLLRGSEALAKEEIKEYSLTNICGRRVNRWQLFKDRTFLKSLAISLVFNIGGQLMGHNVILCYLQTILELTDTDVEPEVASIVIGCVSVVASVSTFFFMKKFGRKLILAVTMCIAAIGLICVLHPLPRCNDQLGTGMLYMFQIGLGLFFEMQENGFNTKGYVSYLPLFSMILFYFCTASGFSTISAIVTSELFDGPARATGMAAVNMVVAVVLFLQGQYFMALTSVVGFPTVFWMFSVDSVLTCLFVIFFVPETKGRTFGEIQKELGRKCDDVVSSEM